MKQALEALDHEANKGNDNAYQCERDALRAAIEQAEKPMAWFHADNYKTRFTTDPSEEMVGKYWKPLYTAPRQEPYDQTSLELCEECGWKAIIPGDGCLVCARQKAKPVAWMYDFLADNRDEVIREWVTQSQDDIKRENGFNVRPLYTVPPAAPKPYRRGTYVRCMESDELCRVYTTSIDGGAWVRWPDGSITTYTAEQMGQAFSLEQAAPGEPAGYLKNGELFTPLEIINSGASDAVPLYEHPRQWVELTDDEARALVNRATFGDRTNWQALVYMVDAKLKEKNAA